MTSSCTLGNHVQGLAQNCSNSITISLKLLQSCTKPSMCSGRKNNSIYMMTSSNGNIFRVTGHLCGEFTGPGALMLSLRCVWINDRVNNREAGDFRRYRAHYDVIVMRCHEPNEAVSIATQRLPKELFLSELWQRYKGYHCSSWLIMTHLISARFYDCWYLFDKQYWLSSVTQNFCFHT